MEELELYIKNTFKNEKLNLYEYILGVLKNLLKDYKIENGGLDKDSDGNITKVANNIKIFIENSNTNNTYVEVALNLGTPEEKQIVFYVDSTMLNNQEFIEGMNYQLSPLEFTTDISDKQKGTISIQEDKLYYFDKESYDYYVSKTRDTNPTYNDYEYEEIDSTNSIILDGVSIADVCENIKMIVKGNFNTPLVEEAIGSKTKKDVKQKRLI